MRISYYPIPYFCRKLGKMSLNVSSAAVMIGALRVNSIQQLEPLCLGCYDITFLIKNILDCEMFRTNFLVNLTCRPGKELKLHFHQHMSRRM